MEAFYSSPIKSTCGAGAGRRISGRSALRCKSRAFFFVFQNLPQKTIDMAEDRLRQEAKNLIEQIKHLRVQGREARESNDEDWPLLAAREAGGAPALLDNPKMRRVLKGHFGKVRENEERNATKCQKCQICPMYCITLVTTLASPPPPGPAEPSLRAVNSNGKDGNDGNDGNDGAVGGWRAAARYKCLREEYDKNTSACCLRGPVYIFIVIHSRKHLWLGCCSSSAPSSHGRAGLLVAYNIARNERSGLAGGVDGRNG